jgi:predicted metal-dependent HD superfamily phosphohydrolase
VPDLPWPLAERTDLRDRLLAAYSTGRGYHDLQHLSEVLARIDELGEADNTEIVLAGWFHDAVYDGARDDEERSANWVETELADAGVDGEVDIAEVARLVRLTAAHDPAVGDHAGEVLCDADLAILAAGPERYREYTAGVRRDYDFVPEDEFRAGRLAVLEELLSRESLFRTAYARQAWDSPARENLSAEIAVLRSAE